MFWFFSAQFPDREALGLIRGAIHAETGLIRRIQTLAKMKQGVLLKLSRHVQDAKPAAGGRDVSTLIIHDWLFDPAHTSCFSLQSSLDRSSRFALRARSLAQLPFQYLSRAGLGQALEEFNVLRALVARQTRAA